MWFLRKISLRHARRHLVRTLVAIAGVAIGASTVVATRTVAAGAVRAFDLLVAALAGDADFHVANGSAGVPERLVPELMGVAGVATAAPLVEGAVARLAGASDSLDVFGVDVLGDRPWAQLVPRAAVRIPDEAQFIANDDSVVMSSRYAARNHLEVGSRLEVLTPTGARTLVVRGTVTHPDLERLLGERFLIMDIAAAQALLDKLGRYDRIDVRVVPGADERVVRARMVRAVAGSASVEEPHLYGRNATKALGTLDVMLQVTAMLTMMVGFFVVYHTIAVSIVERTETLRQLRRIGASARALRCGLLAEASLLGALAGIAAAPLGMLLAWFSVGILQQASSNWLRLPRPALELSIGQLGAGVAVAIAASCAATVLASRRVLDASMQPVGQSDGGAGLPWRLAGFGAAVAIATMAVALRFRGPLPTSLRATYVMSTNGLLQLALGMTAPIVLVALARAARRCAARTSWLGIRLSASTALRDPGAPTAVVTGIVIALGATLSIGTLMTSVKKTFLDLVEELDCDVMVTGGDDLTRLIPRATIPARVVDALRTMDGVAAVETLRTVSTQLDARPVVLEAVEEVSGRRGLIDGIWNELSASFRAGDGVFISDTLALMFELGRGDTVEVRTPGGVRGFRVLGVRHDLFAGDAGSIAVYAPRYREIWGDSSINRLFIGVTPAASAASVRDEIVRRYGITHGLRVVTSREASSAVTEMVDESFAGAHALLVVMVAVAMLGVVNFLLAALVSRRRVFALLHAIGLTVRQMHRALVAEAGLIALTAISLGLLGGWLAGFALVRGAVPALYGWRFDFVVPIYTALALACFTLVLALLAAALPARLSLARTIPKGATQT